MKSTKNFKKTIVFFKDKFPPVPIAQTLFSDYDSFTPYGTQSADVLLKFQVILIIFKEIRGKKNFNAGQSSFGLATFSISFFSKYSIIL